MLKHCFILAVFAVWQNSAQTLHSCQVPTYCRRTPGGAPEAIWTDLQGNVVSPAASSPAPPPTPPSNMFDMSFPDPFAGQDLSDAEKVRILSGRINLLNQPGWFNADNNYQYWLSGPGVAVPYSIAQTICRSMNSRIAVVGIRNDAARSYIVDNILRRCGDIHAFWIGYTDVQTEGTFVWNDGLTEEGQTTNWAPQQPDNYDNADCAVISRDMNYQWDDVPCEGSNNGILCERYVGNM